VLPLLSLAACAHPDGTKVAGIAGACDQARVATLAVGNSGQIPTIEAEIGGRPLRFTLSGNDNNNELTAPAARWLNLPTRTIQTKSVLPDGKPVPITVLRIPQLDIGNLHFVNLAAKQVDHLRVPGGPDPDGALAIAQLRDFSVDIDLPRHRVSLYGSSACNSKTYPFSGTVITMDMVPDLRNRPVIPVSLDGKTRTALIDPSFPSIVISARAAGLTALRDAKSIRGPGNTVWHI
jgi:hypothetical protein